MQAVQTSSVPTLPAAPSLWRSAGFPSAVSRPFSEAHKHRAATVKGVFVSALFLYSPRAVPLQLNKHRTVANAAAKSRQRSSEDGPSGEMRIRELEWREGVSRGAFKNPFHFTPNCIISPKFHIFSTFNLLQFSFLPFSANFTNSLRCFPGCSHRLQTASDLCTYQHVSSRQNLQYSKSRDA